MTGKKDDFIWAVLLHFGTNMWCDQPIARYETGEDLSKLTDEDLALNTASDRLRCDETVWRRFTERMSKGGLNMVVIDVGEGLRLTSHPELAVKGSWAIDRFRAELARLRGLGLEPIPKLNFSAAHDIWLKDYSRMLSTPEYHRVCADVITEVAEIFDKPRFFHLGYDEENWKCQRFNLHAAVRQGELWWSDFLRISGVVEKLGIRPWIWSDYCWGDNKDEFIRRMPKSVLQSNWYYGEGFMESKQEKSRMRAQRFIDLSEAGFDQIPCGSNYGTDANFGKLVRFCDKEVVSERLMGYLMAPWFFTVPGRHERKALEGIDLAVAAKIARGRK